MTDFGGRPAPDVDGPVEDDPAADTGADEDPQEAREGRAGPRWSSPIVATVTSFSITTGTPSIRSETASAIGYGRAKAGDVRRVREHAAVGSAGGADPHGGDRGAGDPRADERGCDAGRHRVRDWSGPVRGVVAFARPTIS